MEPTSIDPDSQFHDTRFLHRWRRWHRLGWLPYLACSLLGWAILTTITVLLLRNLLDHGTDLSAWQGLTRPDYYYVGGSTFASVAILLGRFSRNEARYKRLTQPSPKLPKNEEDKIRAH